MIVPARSSVAIALICGVTPNRTWANTTIGLVCTDPPARNADSTSLSNEYVNAKRKLARIQGSKLRDCVLPTRGREEPCGTPKKEKRRWKRQRKIACTTA